LAPIIDRIQTVESQIHGRADQSHRYIPLPDSGRLLRTGAVAEALRQRRHPGDGNPELALRPTNLRTGLKWLRQWALDGLRLPCRADLIVVRSHISLFYFKAGIRIKIERRGPDRTHASIQNEVGHRNRIPAGCGLRAPRIVSANVDRAPHFMVDEIVPGRMLPWTSPEAPAAFERLIPCLWAYYRHMGINWATPRQRAIDLAAVASDYGRLLRARPGLSFPFDVDRLLAFQDRPAPCTVIHGDVAVHNLIVSRDGIYLTDWELAGEDFILRNIYKLLLIPHWRLGGTIGPLLAAERDRFDARPGQAPLSFAEQFHLILFLEVHAMLADPDYPPRRLKRLQHEIAYGVNAFPIGRKSEFGCLS
jgi:hypothetical protein